MQIRVINGKKIFYAWNTSHPGWRPITDQELQLLRAICLNDRTTIGIKVHYFDSAWHMFAPTAYDYEPSSDEENVFYAVGKDRYWQPIPICEMN